jgi:hypothetical protein
VLECEDQNFKYEVSDDIFSLTFSFIYLLYPSAFTKKFQEYQITQRSRVAIKYIRKSVIRSFHGSKHARKALRAAEKGKYKKARKYIITFLGKNLN